MHTERWCQSDIRGESWCRRWDTTWCEARLKSNVFMVLPHHLHKSQRKRKSQEINTESGRDFFDRAATQISSSDRLSLMCICLLWLKAWNYSNKANRARCKIRLRNLLLTGGNKVKPKLSELQLSWICKCPWIYSSLVFTFSLWMLEGAKQSNHVCTNLDAITPC